ncbi:MAG: transglutaminase-like domain-containing protein [Caldilineaceae bacterium]
MSSQSKLSILAYYTKQSPITNPGQYISLFDDLSADLPALFKVVQGLLHHPYEIPPARQSELMLRTVPEMIGGILQHDPAPLTAARPPEKRLYGLCRDYAVLLVSMLRHHGIPARERVGFGGYFKSEWFWDHRIAEYWNQDQQAWVLVDPQYQANPSKSPHRQVDSLHITRTSPYLLAGQAWQLCRRGEADPDTFVDSPTDRGLAMIRYALLHDLDALNKVELVGMDAWHELIDKPEAEVTADERLLLDKIAALTVDADANFGELQALYAQLPYGLAVQGRLNQELPNGNQHV